MASSDEMRAMKLLLDTHIWIWNELEPSKLTSEIHQQARISAKRTIAVSHQRLGAGLLGGKKRSTELRISVNG
jgi:hypothetical protein